MKKSYQALTIFCFVTDSKIYQTLNYYLKSTKQIARQSFYPANSLNRAWLHKCIQNSRSKLVVTKVNFGSKFV